MKTLPVTLALACSLIVFGSSLVQSAETAEKPKLDVLKMSEIPTGFYDVQLQFAGENQTVRLAIKGNRAAFVKADVGKLDEVSGKFEFIGNGVFMAQLAGRNHRATQWWIFHPDGTASIKEMPDRGEKQTAKPVNEK